MINIIWQIDKIGKTIRLYFHKKPTLSKIANIFKMLIDVNFTNRPILRHNPTVMGVFINNKCNLRCSFCFYPWNTMQQRDMTVDEFKTFIDHKLFKDIIRISLTGGEVLLHPDLFEFVEIASRKNIAISIVTNGTLLSKFSERLLSSKIDSLMFSHYDEQFPKVEPYLKKFIQDKIDHNVRLYVLLSKVITNENYYVMDGLIEKALELRIDGINFNSIFVTDESDIPKKVIYEDNKEFSNCLKYLKNKYNKEHIDITYPQCVKRDALNLNGCIYLRNMISVDIAGNISPCCFLVPPAPDFGNIFSDKDPFNNSFYQKIRTAFKEKNIENYYIKKYCKNCFFAYSTPLKVI